MRTPRNEQPEQPFALAESPMAEDPTVVRELKRAVRDAWNSYASAEAHGTIARAEFRQREDDLLKNLRAVSRERDAERIGREAAQSAHENTELRLNHRHAAAKKALAAAGVTIVETTMPGGDADVNWPSTLAVLGARLETLQGALRKLVDEISTLKGLGHATELKTAMDQASAILKGPTTDEARGFARVPLTDDEKRAVEHGETVAAFKATKKADRNLNDPQFKRLTTAQDANGQPLFSDERLRKIWHEILDLPDPAEPLEF